MKWVRDLTGRFAERPHYDPKELDQECENTMSTFLRGKYGSVTYPIITDDIVRLLERESQDFDQYADLAPEGRDVEGMTTFFRNQKPQVRIARELTNDAMRENRLRTTLTHELGHVKFHNFMLSFTQASLGLDGASASASHTIRCKRETILRASRSDWMEWQAGYASCAYLMPISRVRRVVGEVLQEGGLYGAIALGTPTAGTLIEKLQLMFQVSADAARIRLLVLGHLTEQQIPQQSLL